MKLLVAENTYVTAVPYNSRQRTSHAMTNRKFALIALGPAAVLGYCSFFAYQYREPYLFLAGLAVALGFAAFAWRLVNKRP